MVVTSNPDKAEEIGLYLKEYLEVEHIAMEIPEYRDDDVAEIAKKKGEYAYQVIQKPLIVDDTAFCIDTLHGFPGPYAAYVQKTLGNAGILKLMENQKDRNAYFETAIAFVNSKGIRVFRGRIEGIIVPERGSLGFGYDPIFEWEGRTLAELSTEEKSWISHRARALAAFKKWLKEGGIDSFAI
ncbi:MAG TPA: RdgB/HAM1 family non-canonical purine NTP pyrophosphatase [Methanoregulaceae archaeon]|nr:RdgB/HAM1 family non-canonical purine NTP pyrophosphatase [Methanoregulaceae archaeon]